MKIMNCMTRRLYCLVYSLVFVFAPIFIGPFAGPATSVVGRFLGILGYIMVWGKFPVTLKLPITLLDQFKKTKGVNIKNIKGKSNFYSLIGDNLVSN